MVVIYTYTSLIYLPEGKEKPHLWSLLTSCRSPSCRTRLFSSPAEDFGLVGGVGELLSGLLTIKNRSALCSSRSLALFARRCGLNYLSSSAAAAASGFC